MPPFVTRAAIVLSFRTKLFELSTKCPCILRVQTGWLVSRLNADVNSAQTAFTDTLSSISTLQAHSSPQFAILAGFETVTNGIPCSEQIAAPDLPIRPNATLESNALVYDSFV